MEEVFGPKVRAPWVCRVADGDEVDETEASPTPSGKLQCPSMLGDAAPFLFGESFTEHGRGGKFGLCSRKLLRSQIC